MWKVLGMSVTTLSKNGKSFPVLVPFLMGDSAPESLLWELEGGLQV